MGLPALGISAELTATLADSLRAAGLHVEQVPDPDERILLALKCSDGEREVPLMVIEAPHANPRGAVVVVCPERCPSRRFSKHVLAWWRRETMLSEQVISLLEQQGAWKLERHQRAA